MVGPGDMPALLNHPCPLLGKEGNLNYGPIARPKAVMPGKHRRRRPLNNRRELKKRSRALRNRATPAEAELWKMLQKSQLEGRKFRRQHSIGPYIVDFYCPAERLAVELDGAVHDDSWRWEYDDTRTAFLHQHDIRVLRFENRNVFEQPDLVLQAIAGCFGDHSTSPRR